MDKICGIYKITSPSGKVYIGQSRDVLKRKNDYSRLYQIKNQTRVFNSIQKYGFEKHTFEIIEECNIEFLNQKERYWQDFYDVIGVNGLNSVLTETEESIKVLSLDTRLKISKKIKEHFEKNGHPFKNRQHSEETKIKQSDCKKGENHPMFGKKYNEEVLIKMSNAKKGDKNPFKNKKHSEESKLKMSLSRKGKSKKGKTIINTLTKETFISSIEVWDKYLKNEMSLSSFRSMLIGKYNNKTNFVYK
jgi:group I intron endonuclease